LKFFSSRKCLGRLLRCCIEDVREVVWVGEEELAGSVVPVRSLAADWWYWLGELLAL